MKKFRGAADLGGKHVVITGGTDGLGKWTLLRLFERRPKTLLFIGRDLTKARATVAECVAIAETKLRAARDGADIVGWTRILSELKKAKWSDESTFESACLIFLRIDVSDLDQVDRLADYISRNLQRVDILINNAGGLYHAREITSQGLEMTIASNFLGHFWLVNRLIPQLRSSSCARIVHLSSCMHKFSLWWPKQIVVDFKDMFLDKTLKYDFWYQYGLSKLAINLATKGFDRWCKVQDIDNVISLSVFPGIVLTAFNRGLPPLLFKITEVFRILGPLVGHTIDQAGQSLLFASLSSKEEVESGGYYFNCAKASENPFVDRPENIKIFWNSTLTLLKRLRPDSAFNLTSL